MISLLQSHMPRLRCFQSSLCAALTLVLSAAALPDAGAATKDGKKLTDTEKALSPAWLDEVKAIGAHAAVWNKQVDAAAVKAAHERGLKVWVYTVNDVATAHQLLAAGVDGIITDNPAILWKAIATK